MTVRELLARTDSRELAEWMAYEQIDGPLGPERGDYHAAILAHTTASVWRGKDDPPLLVADFLPRWDAEAPVREQSSDEQYEIARQINRMFGGTEG